MMETKHKAIIGTGILGLTGVILAATVPAAKIEDEHTFEQCDGAKTHLIYKAFLLGNDSIDVTVSHSAFSKDMTVKLERTDDQYNLQAYDNPWLLDLVKDNAAGHNWKNGAINAYNKWRSGGSDREEIKTKVTQGFRNANTCYTAVKERINDIASNPAKYKK